MTKCTPFLTRRNLAERWGVSIESIKRYERRGIVHPVKIAPRVVRYRVAEVEAYETGATLDRAEA